MGKKRLKNGTKKPLNHSLSLTLPYLKSKVELELRKRGGLDFWEPLERGVKRERGVKKSVKLSSLEKKRFLDHFGFLKKKLNFKGNFILRSKNNFPLGAGIASSASSFASLTLAAWKAGSDLKKWKSTALEKKKRDTNAKIWEKEFFSSKKRKKRTVFDLGFLKKSEVKTLSSYSGMASGSSARSFFYPWCLLDKKKGAKECAGMPVLYHMVVVVKNEKKVVSSSLAHELVVGSSLFKGRSMRAENRLVELTRALRNSKWSVAFQIVWSEFWDMHALFETAQKPFGYFEENSVRVLNNVKKIWQERGSGPLVTMDAGSSVHLLFREDQRRLGQRIFSDFKKKFLVLCDPFFLNGT